MHLHFPFRLNPIYNVVPSPMCLCTFHVVDYTVNREATAGKYNSQHLYVLFSFYAFHCTSTPFVSILSPSNCSSSCSPSHMTTVSTWICFKYLVVIKLCYNIPFDNAPFKVCSMPSNPFIVFMHLIGKTSI